MNTNPIYQVLVVANTGLLAAGNKVHDLAVGQLGIFNALTGVSVASTALPDKFFFAVGQDRNGDSVLDNIGKSAGQHILKHMINTVYSKNYDAGSNQVISLDLSSGPFDPQYGEDYTVTFEFKSGKLLQRDGYTLPKKSFTLTLPSTSSGDYPLATFITDLVAEVNKDDEGIITAADAGGSVITFTIGAEAKENTVAGINPYYSFLRQFVVTCSVKNGFEDGGYTLSSTGPVYQQGSGYDIQREEYVAAGWNIQGVYRDSDLLGLFQSAGFTPSAVAATNYWQMRLNYRIPSTSGGFLDYQNEVETLIAIPDSASYQSLINEVYTMANTYLITALLQTGGTLENYS